MGNQKKIQDIQVAGNTLEKLSLVSSVLGCWGAISWGRFPGHPTLLTLFGGHFLQPFERR